MTKKVKIKIEGMHCASCSKVMETVFSKVPGIVSSSVNAVTGKAFVEIDDTVNEKQLKDAVKEAGYTPVSVEFDAGPASSSNLSQTQKGKPVKKANEIHSWFVKLIGVWPLTIILMFAMYSKYIFGNPLLPMNYMVPLTLVLSFPIIFIFGFHTIKAGIRGFYKLYFTMDSLIALGTILAYLTGILSYFIDITSFAGVSGMIMTIFITGKYIEARAKGRATSEIRKLLELGAKNARVLRNEQEIEIPISEVGLGDILIVKPGEKIPTDGLIIKG